MAEPLKCMICWKDLNQENNMCVEIPYGPEYHLSCISDWLESQRNGQFEVGSLRQQQTARADISEEEAAAAEKIAKEAKEKADRRIEEWVAKAEEIVSKAKEWDKMEFEIALFGIPFLSFLLWLSYWLEDA